jgi:uncharacterized protein (TIGR02145 family)
VNQVSTAIAAIGTTLALGMAQAVHISGTVKNGAGAGIESVTVRLGKANLSAVTGQDGNFTLSGSISGIKHPAYPALAGGDYPFHMIDNGFRFSISKPTMVKIEVYGCEGGLLASRSKNISPDERMVALPRLPDGVHIYRISVDDRLYAFRGVTGVAALGGSVPAATGSALAKRTKGAAAIDDALLFTKEGFQLGRLPVTTPDTSGILATLTPLEKGTLTDADGNVYRTIRYGSHVWTVENLRTSKYNDGTSIPLVTDSAIWGALETPAYAFFGYTSDTTEQRKWGAFYNGYAVNTGKLAPAGWHVPTNADWDTLEAYLIAGGYDYDGTTGENKIAKSLAVKTDWLPSADSGAIGNDTLGNNTSGFSGKPNGYCDYAGETYYRNWYAFWWTSTNQDSNFVKIRGIYYHKTGLESSAFTKVYGLSVRLVRDN